MEELDLVTFADAAGILNCLRLLAQEAASLNLLRTLSAIEDALDTVACESGMDAAEEGLQTEPTRPVLH